MDEMGDRMKSYERVGTSAKLDPLLPICSRIDGRSFSRFTKGCEKPFDARVSGAMRAACAYLVDQTHALIGYVQSDEISLIFRAEAGGSVIFDGKVYKMNSVFASMAAVKFHSVYGGDNLPAFDCRTWQLPSETEAANTILWRAMDARKNAVSMACRAHNSAKSMHKKDRAAQVQMLADNGINFDTAYPKEDRHGVFYRRATRRVVLDDTTWDKIPDKHKPPSKEVLRSFVDPVDVPFFGEVEDREGFIFGAA